MVDHSKIGRRSKRKGKTYERRVGKLLTDFTQINFRSVPGSGGFNKFGGVSIREELFCGDVICDSQDFKFCVEAKNRKTFDFNSVLKNPNTAAFSEWWYQCNQDAKSVSLDPLMFFKPDHAADFIAITYQTFLELQLTSPTLLNHFVLNTYSDPVTLKIKSAERRVTEKITTQLPIPYVLDWNEVIAKCSKSVFFKTPGV